MAFIHSPKIITDGLVLALDAGNTKSYPGSGTTWSDLSGNLNSGILTNGPTFNGANGGSIVFDGTNDYVNGSYPTALNSTQAFTLECVVTANASVAALATFQRIISYTSASFNIQLGLARSSTSGLTGIQERVFYVTRNVGSTAAHFTVANIPTGSIYHVVSTFNGISTHQMYLNGIASVNNGATSTTIASSVNANTFFIGQRGDNAGYVSGSIYNVKVYNRALSANEVLQNFNATRGRFGV